VRLIASEGGKSKLVAIDLDMLWTSIVLVVALYSSSKLTEGDASLSALSIINSLSFDSETGSDSSDCNDSSGDLLKHLYLNYYNNANPINIYTQ
jgi:hypothetical protein